MRRFPESVRAPGHTSQVSGVAGNAVRLRTDGGGARLLSWRFQCEESIMQSTIDRDAAATRKKGKPALACGVFMVGAMLFASIALAESDDLSQARARYQRERAACLSGQSNQDRATCLKEAGAALQAARRGNFTDDASTYDRNRLLRCERVAAADREDCLRRMRGEGTVSGSAESGGIYRELRTTVPAQ
jgi:hypothetical protein